MEKENVDNLFRDTLDDFAQTPDPKVWDRIQASLDRKAQRKQRAIPLWWQLGGVAAALALILFLTLPGTDPEVTIPANEQTTSTPSDINVSTEEPEDLEFSRANKEAVTDVNSIANPDKAASNSGTPLSNQIATTTTSNTADNVLPDAGNGTEAYYPITDTDPAVTQIDSALEEVTEDPVTDTPITTDDLGVPDEKGDLTKTPSLPAIAEVQEEETKKEFRDLFEEIGDEEKARENEIKEKWAVGPSVAPVLYAANGTGSPIDNAFINNDKTGNINMSYGVKVTYRLSDKWQLRSGLHKVDYTYNTNDIVFTSSLSASANSSIRNIDFASTSDYLVVESSSVPVTKAGATGSDEIAAKNPARSGTMVQEMGYLEIPMEINYVLLDKKIGVNVVSGVSSLMLLDNVVNLESQNGTTEMGTANNINSLNFSANFGLGIDYDLSDKFKVQLEPIIKYQLNTFSNTAGKFNPYTIGIYSGIQYKF